MTTFSSLLRSLLLLNLFFVLPALAQTTPAGKCVNGVHIIAARGRGAAQGFGLLQTTVRNITNAIPGSDSYSVPYKPDVNATLPNFNEEASKGAALTAQAIKRYARSCPNTKIVLLGYSLGAVATMNTLCGASSVGFTPSDPISPQYAKNIIATVVYGDETRAAGQSYNLGTCITFGIFTRLDTAACAPYAPNIRSYCDNMDPNCCVGGLDRDSHYIYPSIYDRAVAKYIVQRYRATK